MKAQEKNKAIAEWLGWEKSLTEVSTTDKLTLKRTKRKSMFWYYKGELQTTELYFHKDRNQQKLIEDKLVEMGYNLKYLCMDKEHKFTIYKGIKLYSAFGKSKDIAFIDAVIELIKSK